MQTKQQQRAEFALNKISTLKIDKETANFYAGAPTMILTNGLGQTMAFLLTKKDKERKLFDILKEWLTANKNPLAPLKDKKNAQFLQAFNELPIAKYTEAQTEALRILEWIKRYAKAFEVKDEKTREKDNVGN
ncbi:MAG: type III-B CRISPR module-associated protein Cmr5 [Campylobacteraceae bacterium]|jgi:CRISPR-associated protein Cmr5|nr:type III-B CRISPR module-associated protein Cmr5 [Campylobacteraceae bacterium]